MRNLIYTIHTPQSFDITISYYFIYVILQYYSILYMFIIITILL